MTASHDPAPSPLALVVPLVAELGRISVDIALDDQNRLQLDGATHRIDAELFERIKLCRELLIWHAVGATTGHRWSPCSQCGLAALIGPGKKPKCRMTPGCKGTCKRPPASKKKGKTRSSPPKRAAPAGVAR